MGKLVSKTLRFLPSLLCVTLFFFSCSRSTDTDDFLFDAEKKTVPSGDRSILKGREESYKVLNFMGLQMRDKIPNKQLESALTQTLSAIPKLDKELPGQAVVSAYLSAFNNNLLKNLQTQEQGNLFARSVGKYLATGHTNASGFEISLAAQLAIELLFLRSNYETRESAEWVRNLWIGASSPSQDFNKSLFISVLNGAYAGLLTTAFSQRRQNEGVLALFAPSTRIRDEDRKTLKGMFRARVTNVSDWIKNTLLQWSYVFKETPGQDWILEVKNFDKISANIIKSVNVKPDEKDLVEAIRDGLKTTIQEAVPRATQSLVSVVTQKMLDLALSPTHMCALSKSQESVFCWGGNQFGQVGNGRTDPSPVPPVQVKGLDKPYLISVGEGYSCAADNAGVKCWGGVGLKSCQGACVGGPQGSTTPVLIKGIGRGVISLSAGPFFACAVDQRGKLFCWGQNPKDKMPAFDFGFSEKGGPVYTASPIQDASDVLGIKVGYAHACYLTKQGDLFCWGNNQESQLGVSQKVSHLARPTKILSGVETFDLFPRGGCAILKRAPHIMCWGKGSAHFIKNGFSQVPAAPGWYVHIKKKPLAISTNAAYFCVLQDDSSVLCWDSEKGIGERRPFARNIRYFAQMSSPSDLKSQQAFNTCLIPRDVSASPLCFGPFFPGSILVEEGKSLSFVPKVLKVFP